jgi:hypothetical protein
MESNAGRDGTTIWIPKSERALGITMKNMFLLKLTKSMEINGLKLQNIFQVELIIL